MRTISRLSLLVVIILVALFLVCVRAFGDDVDSEAALKAQLAQAQVTITRLSQGQKDANQRAAADTVDATQQRATDAAAAQLADAKAVLAAASAKAEADQIMKVQDQNKLATYTTLITTILAFMTLLVKAYIDVQHQKWTVEASNAAKQAAVNQHDAMLIKLGEVGKSADAAYAVANTVNDKIASIGVTMADGKPLSPAG
jgi:hypothetical protein